MRDNIYFEKTHKYSNSLDILASYLKGQKIIYMESKSFCEYHLNPFEILSLISELLMKKKFLFFPYKVNCSFNYKIRIKLNNY